MILYSILAKLIWSIFITFNTKLLSSSMRLENAVKQGLLGFAFGLTFPTLAILLDVTVFQHLPMSWENILEVHRRTPLHFIIDTAPFVLGFTFFLLSPKFTQVDQKDLSPDNQRPTRKLRFSHLFSLFLLASLIIASQYFVTHTINEQRDDGSLINLAGRQRMLSQNISKNLLLLQQYPDSLGYLKKTLRQLSDEFQEGHQVLIGKKKLSSTFSLYKPSDNLLHHLNQTEPFLTELITQVNQALIAPSQLDVPSLLESEQRFLKKMEITVNALEKEAARNIERLEVIEKTLMIILLMVLLFEWLLVFRPAMQKMYYYISERESVLAEEKAMNDELNMSNKKLQEARSDLEMRERLLKKAERIHNIGSYEHEMKENGRINYSANFKKLLGIPNMDDSEIRESGLKRIIEPDDLHYMSETIQKKIEAKEKSYQFLFHAQVRKKRRTFEDRGTIVYDQKQHPMRLIGVISDVTEKEVKRLQKLRERQVYDGFYSYIMASNTDLVHQYREVLYFTMRVLKMDNGTVGRIVPEHDLYEIHTTTPGSPYSEGDQTLFSKTCCSIQPEGYGVLALPDIAQSRYKEHPCFQEAYVAAYIGVALKVNGKRWGSLAFASSTAREPFSNFEENFILNAGQWISSVLERIETEKKLIGTRTLAEERAQKITVQSQKIQDSIRYALRIQSALMPTEADVKARFNDAFVFYKPRDIVSGDFFWVKKVRHKTFLVASDCTGHGVPGGFMSMMGIVLLNEFISMLQIQSPDLILYELHRAIQRLLNQEKSDSSQDGMDITVCVWDSKTHILEFAGAKNDLVYVQGQNMERVKGDRLPVGGRERKSGDERLFTKHEIQIEEPTNIYLFSDGYADQFGGDRESPRKFSQRRLREFLHEIAHLDFQQQKSWVARQFEEWKAHESQIDDVLVMGCRLVPK